MMGHDGMPVQAIHIRIRRSGSGEQVTEDAVSAQPGHAYDKGDGTAGDIR
jgi:hypothetical protein